MVKKKYNVTASTESARINTQEEDTELIKIGPGPEGNEFDIRMSEEPDGMEAAKKIMKIVKERGVCVIKANAPPPVVQAAYQEAEDLWEDDEFRPPMKVSDDRSNLEAQCMRAAMTDEEKVVWIGRPDQTKAVQTKQALAMLANNMSDFGAGMREGLLEEAGIEFDRKGHVMLSCYTGERQYSFHIDNGHEGDPDTLVDNGQRLTLCYFINTHWEPTQEQQCGGLDVYLTDPKQTPSSASSAKAAGKLRIAPQADTLVLFLSQRMAHKVISTVDETKWFCMTLWFMNAGAMNQMAKNMHQLQMQRYGYKKDDDSDDDD